MSADELQEVPADELKKRFLNEDFWDAFRGLFIAAISWQAHPEDKDERYQRGLAASASFVQARALYEFFYGPKKEVISVGHDARAGHFVESWKPEDIDGLYEKYMAAKTPGQKRVFHLVYGRAQFSGGTGLDGPDHLKNRVVDFAKDLLRLARQLAEQVEEPYRALAEGALAGAFEAAAELAKGYGIPNPLVD